MPIGRAGSLLPSVFGALLVLGFLLGRLLGQAKFFQPRRLIASRPDFCLIRRRHFLALPGRLERFSELSFGRGADLRMIGHDLFLETNLYTIRDRISRTQASRASIT